jgi:hypothetical protein
MLTWADASDFAMAALAGLMIGWLVRYIRFLNRPASLTPARSGWTHLVGGAVGGMAALLFARRAGWTVPGWDWILVASLGGAVAVGELASRYRDAPIKAILSIPATIYVLLNAAAAVTALLLGRHFELWRTASETAADAAAETIAWSEVLSAGLGAMVLLRSSVFQIRVNGQDVGVGPSSFLHSVIDAADRAVDRLRAQERAWAVARVMEGVSSEKAMRVLPSYISALMQNIKPEEQGAFDEKVKRLSSGSESEQVKSLILGLLAMNYTGEGVLRAAVTSLAAEIREATETASDSAAKTVATAREAKTATEGVVAAVRNIVAKATGAPDTPSEVARAAEVARTFAAAAETAADRTLNQTIETREAAQSAAAVAAAAVRVANNVPMPEAPGTAPTPPALVGRPEIRIGNGSGGDKAPDDGRGRPVHGR